VETDGLDMGHPIFNLLHFDDSVFGKFARDALTVRFLTTNVYGPTRHLRSEVLKDRIVMPL
jgi:hypothetical protein